MGEPAPITGNVQPAVPAISEQSVDSIAPDFTAFLNTLNASTLSLLRGEIQAVSGRDPLSSLVGFQGGSGSFRTTDDIISTMNLREGMTITDQVMRFGEGMKEKYFTQLGDTGWFVSTENPNALYLRETLNPINGKPHEVLQPAFIDVKFEDGKPVVRMGGMSTGDKGLDEKQSKFLTDFQKVLTAKIKEEKIGEKDKKKLDELTRKLTTAITEDPNKLSDMVQEAEGTATTDTSTDTTTSTVPQGQKAAH